MAVPTAEASRDRRVRNRRVQRQTDQKGMLAAESGLNTYAQQRKGVEESCGYMRLAADQVRCGGVVLDCRRATR